MNFQIVRPFWIAIAALSLCSCKSTNAVKPIAAQTHTTTIFMIGDSTMANKPLIPAQPERGWGQLLPLYFKSDVRIDNLALNGRSSKSFRDEGHWAPVMENATNGDFVIIQFGHNDSKPDTKRHTEAFGSFKENLVRYVKEARQKGATPILATSIVRRAFTNQTELIDTHGDYIVAARQVASEQSVPLLDLNRDTQALVTQLGPERSKQLFMWVESGDFESVPKGKQDDTHLNAYGATRVCDLAVKEMKEVVPALAEHLKPSR